MKITGMLGAAALAGVLIGAFYPNTPELAQVSDDDKEDDYV